MIEENKPEADPLDTLDSVAMILAYCFHVDGPDGLRAVLAEDDRPQESMLQDAEELAATGLKAASDIGFDIAKKATPLAAFILNDDNIHNVKSSLASLYRNGKLGPASIAYLEEHADDETLAYVTPRSQGHPH